MILDIQGTSLTGPRNVIVPTRSKIYLAVNNTTGGQDVTVKTVAGTGPTIAAGEGQWVFCDGTNVLAASAATATTAGTATTATDADALIGVAGASYARKDVAQTFQKGQVVERPAALTLNGGNLDIDCSVSNSFYHLATASFNLAAPTNATNGQQFSLIIEQGAAPPHAITFQASTFLFAGGVAPSLSTGLGDVDYLAFEYVTGLSALNDARWIGSIIKDVS